MRHVPKIAQTPERRRRSCLRHPGNCNQNNSAKVVALSAVSQLQTSIISCFQSILDVLALADHLPEEVQQKRCPLSAGEVLTGRPKGLPKTGGRRRGTPNRATLSLREKVATRGYDPIDELITMSRDHTTPLEMRVRIHFEICSYIYPKRKPVDQSMAEPVSTN